MMHCVLAFLLTSNFGSKLFHRIALVSDSPEGFGYGVCQNPDGNSFSFPSQDPDIFSTTGPKPSTGTDIRAYCSTKWGGNEILAQLAKYLGDRTHNSQGGLAEEYEVEEKCRRSISSLIQTPPRLKHASLTKILQIGQCDEQMIANQAVRGFIKVIGEFRRFSQSNDESYYIINADKPVSMGSVVSNGEIFMVTKVEEGFKALAWYQGHLHLFQRNLNDDLWHPITDLISSQRNGQIISQYVWAAHDSLSQIKRHLEKVRDQTESTLKKNIHRLESGNIITEKKLSIIIKNTHLKKLVADPANGRLG
ncbi:BgTH12-05969 [Blumeria graminis f. sp. triticale]|uniref:BgtE-5629 n=3 Tax=Blumeria graminis TaxID=34373 RepID=A0A381LIN9_BLUGR|nr:putative secreted effector protein [Blumeria graminis f. sp. tritici 96224]CAD6504236.1 BgTH12-05969 [Blumeria graminis f. sp. triticale]VDB91051.1 BgtE-5629 [Blumeria graminis f. sp. tritici]